MMKAVLQPMGMVLRGPFLTVDRCCSTGLHQSWKKSPLTGSNLLASAGRLKHHAQVLQGSKGPVHVVQRPSPANSQIRGSRRFTVAMGNSEEAAAATNVALKDTGAPTIFDKIVKKEIPCTSVYEDDKCLAFKDISPQAPVHIVLIPKERDGLTQLSKAEERHKDILGHLLYVAQLVAKQQGLDEGFRIVINDGAQGCQSVYHLHIHIIGGRMMKWPPG
ncbi:hypothetical protein CBR_g50359 [Chara braunii]|uniref:HIT domain-containing protein n=2 Tax=Chara braunii TaxID=69332 RepID=A0A388K5I6_CHABU|nr:hypothetical protein CBR_g50359 [Chara braunii]|eukprot:GBG65322.1 hypothetical protein CBR_g50359 [Chara braunii]